MDDICSLPISTLHALLAPITMPFSSSRARFRNWANTFACTPLAVFQPRTPFECRLVLELACRDGQALRVVGVGHSPSDLACTSEYMLRTEKLDKMIAVDREKKLVVVECGMTLNALNAHLAAHGLALSILGSISDQTIGGAIVTATHGTGVGFPVMSSHVIGLTMLLADGTLVKCSRAVMRELFLATLCGMGSTGMVLEIFLQVEDAFYLREDTELLSVAQVTKHLPSIANSAEHVRIWWFVQSHSMRVSRSNRTIERPSPVGVMNWFWQVLIGYHLVQLLLFLARYHTSFNGRVSRFVCWLGGPKSSRVDVGHRIFNLDCRYPQYATEWAIPFERSQACIDEMNVWLSRELADPHGIRPHFPIEIRFSCADDIYLSPSFGRATCWLGTAQFRPYGFAVSYRAFFSGFSRIAAAHGGRPHWAKDHAFQSTQLRAVYPCFDVFRKVLTDFDPLGRWRNAYIRRHLFDEQSPASSPRAFKARNNGRGTAAEN